jgi:predicted nuclease of predicted toxin-antitoxin system
MRFLLDAMLPRRLARRLVASGHDAVHTLDLPSGNRTPDRDIVALADRDARAVMTKDADFVSSHVIAGRPSRLVLISTGNIGNDALERRLCEHLAVIEQALMERGFVELAAEGLVIHES